MLLNRKRSIIDVNDTYAQLNFSKFFKAHISSLLDDAYKSLILLCIGTDRSTGDSLGPIIGYKLSNFHFNNIHVLGTLEEPVHAKNLTFIADEIRMRYKNPFIISIDACLGHQENIGHINIQDGPIYPGAGVNKNLLPIGNMNITGVVNASGYMEYFVLQNTRLSLVMKMADIISSGMIHYLKELDYMLSLKYMQI